MTARSFRNPAGPAVIVDPYSSGALFAPAFKEAGVPVIAVASAASPPQVYAASYRPEDFDDILVFESDLEPIVRRLQKLGPRCVLPGCESGVELADALASRVVFDVANTPALAGARRHKWEMAKAAAGAGLPIIRQICTADPDQVSAWIDREGLAGRDLVVKPPKSASTDGVTLVPRGDGWRPVFASQIGNRNRLGIVNDVLLVQEFAHGREYVVDTFTHDGVHTVTDVCLYTKVPNGPHMAVYDAMDWVAPDAPDVAEVVAYAKGVLDAVGIRFGSAHVEIMQTADGPRLIEIGARPHGGGQPRFCRVGTGDSQIDRTVRYFAGQGHIPHSFVLRKHLRVVFYIIRADGVAANVEAFDAVPKLRSHLFSTLSLRNGDVLRMTKDLFGSLDVGFAVLAHEDHEQIAADYESIRGIERRLSISTPPN
jgi:biotin carboxylase